MPKFKVRLAEQPTRAMSALAAGALTWGDLRAIGTTSHDMNLLVDLGFVQTDAAGKWMLTGVGRAALVPAEGQEGEPDAAR